MPVDSPATAKASKQEYDSAFMWAPDSILPFIAIGAPERLASSSNELNIDSITDSGSSFKSLNQGDFEVLSDTQFLSQQR